MRRNSDALLIFPPSIDASICSSVGLAKTSRIDSFRSDFFLPELFRLFVRPAFLFGLVRSGAIGSVTAIRTILRFLIALQQELAIRTRRLAPPDSRIPSGCGEGY
jgi:hypothetical protein